MSEKIQPMHTEREDYVYIRQSTMQQLRSSLNRTHNVRAYYGSYYRVRSLVWMYIVERIRRQCVLLD